MDGEKSMSRTRFEDIRDNWRLVKNACRTTVRKAFTDKDASENFKRAMLICEHTPIRMVEFYWRWPDIPYWVGMEWARHKFEKFISSQRNDRQGEYDRNAARQDAPITFDAHANMQNLIDAWRKRLCYQASPEARGLAEDFKRTLAETHEAEAAVLVPNCIYRCGCPEFTPCGRWDAFWRWVCHNHADANIFDIQTRYDLYNEWIKGEK